MRSEHFHGFFRFVQNEKHSCHIAVQGVRIQTRVPVLRKERLCGRQQLYGTAEQCFVVGFHAERAIQDGAVVYDVEMVRVFFQCLFRLQQPRRILLIPVFLQPRETDLQPIVAHLIAEQHIHGGVEKIRKLHDHRQLRLRKPRLPFVDRTDRHAQHLR